MSELYIKISELTQLGGIDASDFLPVVDSGSLTTYRVSIAVWNAFWNSYGSASFAHSSSRSDTSVSSSFSISSSYAVSSSLASSASYVNGSDVIGTVLSASYAVSSSKSDSSLTSTSASHALIADLAYNAVTSSYAISSSHAQTASFAFVAASLLQGGTVPVGTITDFAGDTVSDVNWAICDGSEVDGTTYPLLAALLGTGGSSKWGTATAGYVRLPDFRKRLTLGSDGSLTNLSGSVGNYGGGEFYAKHFHIYGYAEEQKATVVPAPFNNISWKNDDIRLNLIGSVNMDMSLTHPSRSYYGGAEYAYPFYRLTGDNGGSRNQPNDYWGNGSVNGMCFGTSFPINDSGSSAIGYTAANYNRQDDMAMPYAVVNKIIRIS